MSTPAQIQLAVDQLSKSEKGTEAMRYLLEAMGNGPFLVLDQANQQAVLCLLMHAFGSWPGSVVDALSEAVSDDEEGGGM